MDLHDVQQNKMCLILNGMMIKLLAMNSTLSQLDKAQNHDISTRNRKTPPLLIALI